MDVLIAVLELIGGLAFFLYGMSVMSGGLSKSAGGSLERSLNKATSSPVLSLCLGAGITIAIQSSSAMTVMLVGLVNSGLMQFPQTINFIMGSNLGTTVTNWILSLSGVQGGGLLTLLKPESFSPVIAMVGTALIMMSHQTRRQDLGKILVGFAILMYGMSAMGASVDGLKESNGFQSLLTSFENPIVALIVSTFFTGVIQSSAATISIVQNLALTGQITYTMAIPLVLGANIGTCATALISSIGVSREAKKVSVVHITIKVIGTLVCMTLFYGASAIFDFSFMTDSVGMVGVAMIHTVFNVVNTGILAPFHKQLCAIADFIVRPAKADQGKVLLDERLIAQPSIAINEAMGLTVEMARTARSTIFTALDLLEDYDDAKRTQVLSYEDELDDYEDKLGTFLVKLSSRSMSEYDSQRVSLMLHTIGDFERLGDHAVNVLGSAAEIHNKQIHFTPEAREEMTTLTAAIREIVQVTIDSFADADSEKARHVEPLEQVIDLLTSQAKNTHIERLQAGKCSIKAGFVLSDLLTNFERISDHCSNVAVALIETGAGSFGTHEYLSAVKSGDDRDFSEDYHRYARKYGVD